MTTSSSRKNKGFSLLEILLAVGLCAILAAVAVPSMVGWMAEHRLRMKAEELISLVQEAKLQAERTGKAQVVVLLGADEMLPKEAPANVHFLKEPRGTTWSLRGFVQAEKYSAPPYIEIDGSGWVSPVTFRVSNGNLFVEYRFDFLTGHAQEVAFSL
jgi:prepilin-type N-terminal cleavage/methylation domain-containing protein